MRLYLMILLGLSAGWLVLPGAAHADVPTLVDFATVSMSAPGMPRTVTDTVCVTDGRDLTCDRGVYVSPAGQVGIGTSAPSSALHIVGISDSAVSGLTFGDTLGIGRASLFPLSNNSLGLQLLANGSFNIRSASSATLARFNPSNMRIGFGPGAGEDPSATVHVLGTLRLANGGEACDANRTGAIRYTGGDFSFCRNGASWETLATVASASDRIVSGTSSVIVNGAASTISFSTAGYTMGWLDGKGVLGVRGRLDIVTNTGVVAVGSGAGLSSSGSYLTAVGYDAAKNSSGSMVTALGYAAAISNTNQYVTALGITSAQNNAGMYLTAVGHGAASVNQGSQVVAVGYSSAQNNSAPNVTAIGFNSGQFNAGDNLTAVGVNSAMYNSGSYVTAMGSSAGRNNTGGNSSFFGQVAGYNNTGSHVTALGSAAGYNNTGSNVTALGSAAGQNNTGVNVTAVGANAAQHNSSSYVTAVGVSSARQNSGSNVTALGHSSAELNIGTNNIAIGVYAAQNNSGTYVTAIGSSAAQNNNGNNVLALGREAARENQALDVIAIGRWAAFSNTGVAVTVIGGEAGYSNSGSALTALGTQAARYNSGHNVIAIGSQAAQYNTANNVTALGFNAVVGVSNTFSNVTGLGYNAQPTKSNQVMLGDASLTEVFSYGAGIFNKYVRPGSSTTALLPAASSAGAGAIMYDTTVGGLVFSNGSVWTAIGSGGGISDRIVSGTSAVVMNSATGIVSISQFGAVASYVHPSLGYVGPGVSTTGTVSTTRVHLAATPGQCATAADIGSMFRSATTGRLQVCVERY